MERRIAKLIVGKAGGTAGKGSKTYKVSLPSKWITELGLTDSKMELAFDGERIIISPHLSMDKFLESKKSLCHKLLKLQYLHSHKLVLQIPENQ